MSLSTSRIPHLARAIAEKKSSAATVTSIVRQRQALQSSWSRQLTTSYIDIGAVPLPSSTRFKHQSHGPQTAKVRSRRIDVSQPNSRAPNDLNKSFRHGEPEITQDDERTRQEKRKQIYSFGISLFAGVLGIYIFYSYTSYRRDLDKYNQRADKLEQDADVSDRWKISGRNFDKEVDLSERFTFMKRKRRRLVRQAYGDVLEVSCGTGRNLELFDTRPFDQREDASTGRSDRHEITSLTFNDQSEVMIENAKRKWSDFQAKQPAVGKFTGDVEFVVGDAGQPGVIERPPGGFDTIVQSMGVCSMADPVTFLKRLGQLVRQPDEKIINRTFATAKEAEDDGRGGRIFLLEHGRASRRWEWLNKYLDSSAAMHADRYGCWFNKDIDRVIKESGLLVESVKRYSFGTVWEIILRPAPAPAPAHAPSRLSEQMSSSSSPPKQIADTTAKAAGTAQQRWFSWLK